MTRTVVEVERVTAAFVSRRNGAYLLQMSGPPTDDMTPGDIFDCASSLVRVKRQARRWAVEFGYTGPWRWVKDDGVGRWTLTATYTEEHDEYV